GPEAPVEDAMSQFESQLESPRASASGARFDPDTATDHRRKAARDAAERVLARAEFLPPEERRLIEAVYGDGWTIRRVAEVSGVHPRVMSRRINRIVARTLSPEF